MGEMVLKEKLEALMNDPNFGASSGSAEEECDRADDFLTKAKDYIFETKTYIEENKMQCAAGGVAAAVGVGGAVFQGMEWRRQFDNLAAVNTAAEQVGAVNAVRADVLDKLNSGVPLSELKADLVNDGNIRQAWLDKASAQDVQDYLGGQGKDSATMNARHDEMREAHTATTVQDQFAAAAALVQLAVSLVLLGATIKQARELTGKMAEWRKEFDELVAEKVRLSKRVQDFGSDFFAKLGEGTGEGGLDGNILVWVEITSLFNDVLKLQSGFNQLRLKVAEEKGQAVANQWATGTAAATGAVSAGSAWVSVAAKPNPWLQAAAAMQTLSFLAAGTGFVLSTRTRGQLEKFEKEIIENINEVDTLVQKCGDLKTKTDEHWKRYRGLKKEAISKRDQALKEARDREARMMSIMEDMKNGPTPEVMARLAALQAEMAAVGGA